MNDNILNEINNLSEDELRIIIQQKSHLFSEEEMKAVIKRYNSLDKSSNNNDIILTSDTSGFSYQLRKYNIGDGAIDSLTNTRILFRIFKCVNFIKNLFITLLALGVIGAILTVLR